MVKICGVRLKKGKRQGALSALHHQQPAAGCTQQLGFTVKRTMAAAQQLYEGIDIKGAGSKD